MSTTGKEKFEKYFNSGLTQTKTKEDTKLIGWDVVIPKGSLVTVTQNTYSPKVEIDFEGKKGHVKFSSLHKPIHNDSPLPFKLKPDVLGIVGEFEFDGYANSVKDAILCHPEIPSNIKEFLVALVNHTNGIDVPYLGALYSSLRHHQSLVSTLNVDFSEVLAPFAFKNSLVGKIYFPFKGNEPLYDFKIGETLISCKASQGAVNTLKPGNVYDKVIGSLDIRKRFPRELDVLRIIKSTSIKVAPDVLNEWLGQNGFGMCLPSADNRTVEEIVLLERAVAKAINNSELDFTHLIREALSDVIYIRSGLNKDGFYAVSSITKASEIKQSKLRSKNSKGHMTDRLGFDLC